MNAYQWKVVKTVTVSFVLAVVLFHVAVLL